MKTINSTEQIYDSLKQLIETPNMRPYVFRTRFERNMIRIAAYAKEMDQPELRILAENCLGRMQNIIDKSNTTSDGMLRSYTLWLMI
jgi:acetolactate synthase small subunit